MVDFLTESMDAMSALDRLFREHGISYVFIGGQAVIRYGYQRTTHDFDVLVSVGDKDKLANIGIGFLRKLSDKTFRLHEPLANVEVIYSGEISGDGVHGLVFPEPKTIKAVSGGLPFISLPKLVEFKLSSGLWAKPVRLQDFADVQKLIQFNKLPRTYMNKARQDIKDKYIEIWDQTK